MGITAVAVEPSVGPVEAFDHPSRLQCFKVLINGGMADSSTSRIQFLEDVAGTHVARFTPEQVEHHPSLTAETHAELPATLKGVLHALGDQAGAGC